MVFLIHTALKKHTLYNLDYNNPSGTVRVSELDVPLPAMPPMEQMVNYGLPQEQQKFYRTEIPRTLFHPKKTLSESERTFIKEEYHKRINGIWILINGKPIYITGPYYHFLNYWWTKNRVHPNFRYEQAVLYQLWDMVVRDVDCYGMFLIKPRRVGGTEFTLHIEYEYATRVRDVKCGMQSKNDNSAYLNFKRLTKAHKRMIWFMKPIHDGSDDPEEILKFGYPKDRVTTKRLRELAESGEEQDTIYDFEEMGSQIDFGPSVAVHYDGEELNRYILNEFGKLEKMSAVSCWDKVKPCLHYDNGVRIIGKALFESTIEEINDTQIEEMTQFWEDSNPKVRDENNRTGTGLYRVFINAIETSNHDDFGFPKFEENKAFLDKQFDNLKRRNKIDELARLKRKVPLCVEDALTPSGNQSAFNTDKLAIIYERLRFGETTPLTTRGNFKWKDGIYDSKVVFLPDVKGKFEVSQLLKDGDDNAQIIYGGKRHPGNVHKYRGGVDPYDHDEVADKARASKGAGIIMRMYDDMVDGAKVEEKDGISIPMEGAWDWLSKCPVCVYVEREDDPDDFFEDMLMMHIYYGTQMLVENNKQAIKKHFRKRGYDEYVMLRPQETINDGSRSKVTSGIAATTDTIDQYFTAIAHYVMNYYNAIKFVSLVTELQGMNRKNRGKHDLGVAFGWVLLACENRMLDNAFKRSVNQTQNTSNWFQFNKV